MASVNVGTEPPSEIDYSVVDGRVRSFVLRGVKLYDERDGTDGEGWKATLAQFVREQGLDIDTGGRGLHAFVYRLQGEGLLSKGVGHAG